MVMSPNSPMIDIIKFIEIIANKKVSVFIYGESGTGKELVSRAIHRLSKRNPHPFVPINCGAIPKELIESELFGHSKGSFTGAISDKIGRVEMAHKGVLFLDEIGELSLDMQVKFLRVLQEKNITPVGGKYSKDIDFRLVCATNVNIEESIKNKEFREDLFYRINVIPINLPPLRERKADIPALISFFIEQNNEEYETNIQGITNDALEYFMNYQWPGNIRELRNIVERISIIKDDGYIEPKDLPEKIVKEFKASNNNYPSLFYSEENESFDFKEMIDSYQKEIILYSLKKFSWNKKKASEFLKLKRTTFVEMVKRLEIENDETE
jgi:transcriptional regulator with PAS, ATPase and Fis domain